MKYRPIAILLGAITIFSVQFAQADPSGLAGDHVRQGILYANMNDYNNAIQEFKASIDATPTVQAYSNLGASYLQVGKNNLALKALKMAESLDSSDGIVMYNITAAYSLSNDTDLALVYLDKALKNGFGNYDAIRFDPDLGNLRGEPEFRMVLEQNKVFIQ